MYAPLLITIIFTILFIPSLLWVILPYRLYKKYDAKCYYIDPKGEQRHFYSGGLQEKRMREAGREEEVEQLLKYDKKKNFWYKHWSNSESLRGTIFAIISLILVIFLLISILVPLYARDEAMYWTEFAPMAQSVIDNADTAQSVAIAGDIIEYNKWLADAKASKKTYGCWSGYYFINLSSLNYITVN